MSADLMPSGTAVYQATAEQARTLTDRIKVSISVSWELITEAYQSRAYAALGYANWDDYCTREFGTSRLRIPREERTDAVGSLREAGLSIRAIAAATGEGYGTITSARIKEWVDDHPFDVERYQDVLRLTLQNDAAPSIAGAAAIRFGRISPEDTVKFFTLLAHGAGTEGHPIVTLDKRLQRMRREGYKMPARDYLALFVMAWNAWRTGRQTTQFLRPPGRSWSPDNFPVPK